MYKHLVYLYLPTKFGIDIYSSFLTDFPHFYLYTLKNSDFSILLEYQNDPDSLAQEYPIKEVLEYIKFIPINTKEKVSDDLLIINSSSQYKLFDMINNAYKDKYGVDIFKSLIYQKYEELTGKIKLVTTQKENLWKKLNSYQKLAIMNKKLDEVLIDTINMINNPVENEKTIIGNLEHILYEYRKVSGEVDIMSNNSLLYTNSNHVKNIIDIESIVKNKPRNKFEKKEENDDKYKSPIIDKIISSLIQSPVSDTLKQNPNLDFENNLNPNFKPLQKRQHKISNDKLDDFNNISTQSRNIMKTVEKKDDYYSQLKEVNETGLNSFSNSSTSNFSNSSNSSNIIIKKNNYGQYVFGDYGFIYDITNKLILGKEDGNGGIISLNGTEKELCNSLKLNYL